MRDDQRPFPCRAANCGVLAALPFRNQRGLSEAVAEPRPDQRAGLCRLPVPPRLPEPPPLPSDGLTKQICGRRRRF